MWRSWNFTVDTGLHEICSMLDKLRGIEQKHKWVLYCINQCLLFWILPCRDVWCLPPVWNLRAVVCSCCFFCLVFSSAYWPIFLTFFPEKSSVFYIKRWAFRYGSCLAAKRWYLVNDICSVLPYGTGTWISCICHYAFFSLFFFN